MLRILRAFAWMRWRIVVNSLEKTGSRDTLERLSLAAEKLGPIVAAVLLIPSALLLAALGVAAGYALGSGDPRPLAFQATRYILFAVPLLAVIGPLFLPAADRTNPVRLLLLPIPPSTLYVAQSSAAFGDVWNVLVIPLVAGVPLGAAAAGAFAPAVAILVAAILLVVTVVGLASLSTSVLHLVVRDRRRGELVALVFIVLIPVLSMMPSLMTGSRRQRGEPRRSVAPAWVGQAAERAVALYPTEMFARAARRATSGAVAPTVQSLGGLAAAAVLLHGAGLLVFRRVLEQPGSTGARRSATTRAIWARRLPGLSSAASAVATAQLRLALRTPRGRSVLLSPNALLIIFGIMMYRGSGTMHIGAIQIPGGLSLAAFTSFMSILAVLPIAMNQFAVDKAGLTMALLSPLADEELLAGKAAGNALIIVLPVLIGWTVALALFPGGSPYLWLALLLAVPAVYMIVAPVAAICSAVFPRAVDMNSIGRGSNAHGAAGLLGLAAVVAGAVPPLLIAVLATRILGRPALAPVLMLLWCGAAYGIGRLLFVPAKRILAARRENLAMVA